MLVVITGLESWRHLLEGAKSKFEIRSWKFGIFYKDTKIKLKTGKIGTIFDFNLKYIPDTRMNQTDGSSRRPDWNTGVKKNNKNQKLIKEE